MAKDKMSRAEFRRAYRELEELGMCDGYGGAESRRIWQEWQEYDGPLSIWEFIPEAVNVGPEDEE